MANPKGGAFESAVMRYMRDKGFDIERLRLAGKEDEGDLVVKDGGITILECKATRRLDTAAGVAQAMVEKQNYAKHRGFDPETVTGAMLWKVPGKGIGQSLIIMPLDEFFDVEGT